MTEVTIYTRLVCGYCSAAKSLLQHKGIEFRELDATFDPGLRDEMIERAGGARTFPQIFIGDVHVGGCRELIQLERQGRLDGLLETGILA